MRIISLYVIRTNSFLNVDIADRCKKICKYDKSYVLYFVQLKFRSKCTQIAYVAYKNCFIF